MNTSLLCAISYDGLEGYILVQGGCTSQVFNFFLISIIKRYKVLDDEDRLIFIFDNAKIHHNFILKNSIAKKVNVIHLPAYTPVFNPIELYFNTLKNKVYANLIISIDDLIITIHNCMQQ